jgi:hypothetical protein
MRYRMRYKVAGLIISRQKSSQKVNIGPLCDSQVAKEQSRDILGMPRILHRFPIRLSSFHSTIHIVHESTLLKGLQEIRWAQPKWATQRLPRHQTSPRRESPRVLMICASRSTELILEQYARSGSHARILDRPTSVVLRPCCRVIHNVLHKQYGGSTLTGHVTALRFWSAPQPPLKIRVSRGAL